MLNFFRAAPFLIAVGSYSYLLQFLTRGALRWLASRRGNFYLFRCPLYSAWLGLGEHECSRREVSGPFSFTAAPEPVTVSHVLTSTSPASFSFLFLIFPGQRTLFPSSVVFFFLFAATVFPLTIHPTIILSFWCNGEGCCFFLPPPVSLGRDHCPPRSPSSLTLTLLLRIPGNPSPSELIPDSQIFPPSRSLKAHRPNPRHKSSR